MPWHTGRSAHAAFDGRQASRLSCVGCVGHAWLTHNKAAGAYGCVRCCAATLSNQLKTASNCCGENDRYAALPGLLACVRVRADVYTAIASFAGVLIAAQSKKPDTLKRVLLPAVFNLLDVAKTEVRTAISNALGLAVRLAGKDAVLDSAAGLPEDKRARVRAVVDSIR